MIREHKEAINSNFEGTIIDIESIGEFDERYSDSRRYKYIQPVIFGFINRHTLQILCAEGKGAINELKEKIWEIVDELERPFYAFNTDFERGVLFHSLNKKVEFDGELQRGRDSKARTVRELGIPNYDDPFFDNGRKCMIAWENGEFAKAIMHNRACLLKERDILLMRGCIKPDELEFAGD